MNNLNLIVLLVLVVLLGTGTGFIAIAINFGNSGTFMVALVSIFYTYWTGGPGGRSGTGNGEANTS